MEETFDETKLPSAVRGFLVRGRAYLHQLITKRFVDPESAVDVHVESTKHPGIWEMVFHGVNGAGESFRVTMKMYRRGRSQWFAKMPRVFINDVENDDFEGGLEGALSAALAGSGGKIGETQGTPATNSRGARSNAVETRRATVIRN